jgi:hypothetical protein
MSTGLDFMYPPDDPPAFARAARGIGHTFVMRYVAAPGNPKIVTPAEVAAYRMAGLAIGIVFEEGQWRPREGDLAGRADGIAARDQAKAAGLPAGWPIFGAVDFDPLDSELPTVASYLSAGGFECYGNAKTCQYMSDRAVCRHFWQHDWGGGDFAAKHLHQHGGTMDVGGVNCDLNVEFSAGCCIWGLPTASILPEDDDLLTFTDSTGHYRCDPSGAVYAFDPHGKPGGRYLGGLDYHPKDPRDWNAGAGKPNGPPFIFGPTPEGGYVITTRDSAGAFHSYVFPPDGSLIR